MRANRFCYTDIARGFLFGIRSAKAARIRDKGKRDNNVADEDYVYDEDSGEWMPASEFAAKQAAGQSDDEAQVEVRDAVGNVLSDGDQVTLIKSIRLTGDPQEIDCRYPGIKGLVLRAEFVKKR